MINKLTFSDAFSTSFRLAINQFFSVLGSYILWLLTIWIPYINIGTTIGLVRLQIKLGRKELISATDIFDPENRAVMGNMFLLWSFMTTGIVIGFIFFVIPGLVLFYAWILSSMLLLDKKLSPIDSITKSYELTYGYKWTIFFTIFTISLLFFAIQILFGMIPFFLFEFFDLEMEALLFYYGTFGILFSFLSNILLPSIQMVWIAAAYGYIYSVLSDRKK